MRLGFLCGFLSIESISQITSNILHINFEEQVDMTSTLLRFQEFVESDEFNNRYFNLDQFKSWYSKEYGDGKFTYYEDWDGYNIDSKELEPFYEGKFNPLSSKEVAFLELLRGYRNKRIYIIATYGPDYSHSETLKHEIAHGLFATIPDYKKEILKVLDKLPISDIFNLWKFLKDLGYNEESFVDEMHAYVTVDKDWLKKEAEICSSHISSASKEMQLIFDYYFPMVYMPITLYKKTKNTDIVAVSDLETVVQPKIFA